MTNPHIIVGPNNQCLCGRGEKDIPVRCQDLIDGLRRLQESALFLGSDSQFALVAANLNFALRPLIKEIPTP